MFMCMNVCVHMCAHACEDWRKNSRSSFSGATYPVLVLRQGVFKVLKMDRQLGCLATEP